jgi:hypothetical protein
LHSSAAIVYVSRVAWTRKGSPAAGESLRLFKRIQQVLQVHFGNRPHGWGMNPLNWKSVLTAIGWSEVTRTAVETNKGLSNGSTDG